MTTAEDAGVGPAVRAGAVVVAVVTVVGTLLTWTTSVTADRPVDHPAWTAGVWPATGAVLTVLGVMGVAVATWLPRRRSPLVVSAAVVAVAGTATLLVERYAPASRGELLTYVVRGADGPNPVVEAVPDAVAWITAGGLGALAVAFAFLPTRPARGAGRVGVVAAAAGAVLLVVGASVLPWTIGSPELGGVSLWRSSGDARVGAVLLVVGAALALVAAVRPGRSLGPSALLVSAFGLGVVLPDRLPNPWNTGSGWYAYQPLESLDPPAAWQFQAATTLVLAGAVLVVVAAAVVTRRAASRAEAVA